MVVGINGGVAIANDIVDIDVNNDGVPDIILGSVYVSRDEDDGSGSDGEIAI